jgi:hypothetical protein
MTMKCLLIGLLALGSISALAFDSQILAIGETNHDSSHGLDELIRQVQEAGDDVKRVFIEGPRDYKSLYIKLSFSKIDEYKINIEPKYQELICHPLWINQITRLFPVVRSINKERASLGVAPLIVVPIDGAVSKNISDIGIINISSKNLIVSDECSVSERSIIQDHGIYMWLASYEREMATASNFLIEFNGLGKNDKAIVFYHQGHLFKNTKACIPKVISNNIIDVSPRPGSWLQIVLSKKNIDIHVAAIDHERISDEDTLEGFIYGIMGRGEQDSNYINGLFHIFYDDKVKMFDSVINMSGVKYDWLPSIENRFSRGVTCE